MLEGLLIKHVATEWNRPRTAAARTPAIGKARPTPAAAPVVASSKRKPAKEAAR